MMTTHPEHWVKEVAKSLNLNMQSSPSPGNEQKSTGTVSYTFHLEATEERGKTKELISSIKAEGMKVGIAISPSTPVSSLFPYCDSNEVDIVLIMTVVPGKGGQSFISEMCEKVKVLRERYPTIDIEVDGGIKPTQETVDEVAKAGANLIVSGSGVFKAKDMSQSISIMKRSVQRHGNGATGQQLSPLRTDE